MFHTDLQETGDTLHWDRAAAIYPEKSEITKVLKNGAAERIILLTIYYNIRQINDLLWLKIHWKHNYLTLKN